MAKVRCESTSTGLRDSEVVASVRDFKGRRHFIRVEKDFLSYQGDECYFPIGVVQFDSQSQSVLIELPHEAETGANRLWVKQAELDESIEAMA